jgi:Peptidase family M23
MQRKSIYPILAIAVAVTGLVACSGPVSETENVGSETSALAAQTVPMRLPLDPGEWWVMGQRFNQGTHIEEDAFAADIVRADDVTLGENIRSPVAGTVAVSNPAEGWLKINVAGNCASPLPSTQASSTCVQWVPIHMQSVTVAAGTQVNVGTRLGTVGNTGTQDPHLHFGLANVWAGLYQTIEPTYSDYELSTDSGATWDVVSEGMPTEGQWFRARPPWSDWQVVGTGGTSLVGTPAVVAGEVYARNSSNVIRRATAVGASWAAWSSPITGTVSSDPSVVSRASGLSERVLVANRVVSGVESVWVIARNSGTWGAWTNLGGSIDGGARIVWFQGRLHVIGKGSDQRLWRKVLNSNLTTFSDWSQQDATVMKSPPGVAATASVLYVYETKSDDSVYQNFDAGSGFTGWSNIGGQTGSAPAVIAQSDGQVKVFVRGLNDDRLWQRDWTGSFWTSWFPSGVDKSVTFTDSPAVFELASNRADVFARRSNGKIWEKWQATSP